LEARIKGDIEGIEMKTTEVFVEQVLIGLLVMLNLALMLPPEVTNQVKALDKTVLEALFVAAAIATAYLVGIVFDRCADTLLEDIERHCRLKTALQGKTPPIESDPFPEDKYRMKVLLNSEAASYSNYIRTRLRLTRAMAILIPALSVSFLLSKTRGRIADPTWVTAAVSLGVIYGGALVAQLIRSKRIKASDGSTFWYKPPRTNDREAVNEYLAEKLSQKKTLLWGFAACEPAFWGFIAVTVLGLALALKTDCRAFLAVPFLTIALTLLTGWTWWRITKTFLDFLRDFFTYQP
jgi:hypothetical protein